MRAKPGYISKSPAFTHLYLVLGPPPVPLPGRYGTRGPVLHPATSLTDLAWVADDGEIPVEVLIDGHHHEVLLEDVDLPGPALHLIVSPGQRLFQGLHRAGNLSEATEPVSGEDVNPEQIIIDIVFSCLGGWAGVGGQ